MNDEGSKQKNSGNNADDGDVPEPDGLRHPIRMGDEFNGFILDYHSYFLPIVSVILWTFFLFFWD
jgi:hypothetical protein